MQDEWKTVSVLPPLQQDEIQIWRMELSSDPSLLASCSHHLTGEEQARAARRLAGRVRAEFVIGRACLRILLASVLDIPPLDIRFKENSYGKPKLDMGYSGPSFNVSHSNGTILIAFADRGNIGVDVEHIEPSTDIMALAPSVCSSGELARLISLTTEEARRLSFYRCWTRKEAIVKADGRGLSVPLTEFEVTDDVAVNQAVAFGASAKQFFLSEIPFGVSAVAAVATDSPNCRICLLHFPLSELEVLPVQR